MNLREYAQQSEKAPEEKNVFDGMGALMQEQKKSVSDREKATEILKSYDRARVNAGHLVSKILKGCKEAKNPFFIIADAAECIGLLTDESKNFSALIEKTIIEEYAQKKKDPQAIEFEAKQIEKDIARLTASETQNPNILRLIQEKKDRLNEIYSL